MKWTQGHNQNAVAAKARQRLADSAGRKEIQRNERHRKARRSAKWSIQIRDLEYGDSLRLTLYRLPWPGRYVDAEFREHSSASLGALVTRLLRDAP